jgi:DNA-binding MarR family transcriptional regulator
MTRFNGHLRAPSGLRTTQFATLASLDRLGPMTISNLADALPLDRTTLGRNSQPLQRDHLTTASRRK